MSVSIDWITQQHLHEIATMRHGGALISCRSSSSDNCLARLRVRTPYGIRDRKICKEGLTLAERAYLENKGYNFNNE